MPKTALRLRSTRRRACRRGSRPPAVRLRCQRSQPRTDPPSVVPHPQARVEIRVNEVDD